MRASYLKDGHIEVALFRPAPYWYTGLRKHFLETVLLVKWHNNMHIFENVLLSAHVDRISVSRMRDVLCVAWVLLSRQV